MWVLLFVKLMIYFSQKLDESTVRYIGKFEFWFESIVSGQIVLVSVSPSSLYKNNH